MQYFTLTDNWPRAISRWPKCKVMSTSPNARASRPRRRATPVWPHDNALIALGLARYGRKRSIETLFEGLFSAATYMDLGRLPELFCGFKRQRGYGSTLYPVACLP
jgi:glycogen debranching enzyme